MASPGGGVMVTIGFVGVGVAIGMVVPPAPMISAFGGIMMSLAGLPR